MVAAGLRRFQTRWTLSTAVLDTNGITRANHTAILPHIMTIRLALKLSMKCHYRFPVTAIQPVLAMSFKNAPI